MLSWKIDCSVISDPASTLDEVVGVARLVNSLSWFDEFV
jgi:hypothetical protein